ncbi:unnamed protein product [Merluccius merluccius]
MAATYTVQGFIHFKMQAIQVISLTLLSVLAANAQILVPGKCPKPAVKDNFDASQYLGKWYEIQKLPTVFQKGQCGTATYSLNGKGASVVGVLNRELLADGTISAIVGSARATDPSEPAKLEVSFFASPYWVLSTDYTGHSLVFGCREFGPVHAEFAWILSREPTLAEGTLAELHNILTSTGVNINKLTNSNQDVDYCRAMEQ